MLPVPLLDEPEDDAPDCADPLRRRYSAHIHPVLPLTRTCSHPPDWPVTSTVVPAGKVRVTPWDNPAPERTFCTVVVVAVRDVEEPEEPDSARDDEDPADEDCDDDALELLCEVDPPDCAARETEVR